MLTKGQKFECLNGQGFIAYMDHMGSDEDIVNAAKISFGNHEKGFTGKDEHLLRYLMRHRHTTPFEMAEVKILVSCPMDLWRQWIRHRTANVNEYSTRYKPPIDKTATTPPDKWRLQSKNNKQGSDGSVKESVGVYLSEREASLQRFAHEVYQERIDADVAREQARKDLPLSTFTEAYWKCDLHNIFHFLGLRLHPHAQGEIREYAEIIAYEIIKPLFPKAWDAFEDYVLCATRLTRLDKLMIEQLMIINTQGEKIRESTIDSVIEQFPEDFAGWEKEKCRERDECIAKLSDIGIIS